MKTLKYITNRFRSLKATNPKANTNNDNFELTNNRFGFNLKRAPTSGKAATLLTLLYSEENETLFI